MAITFVVGTSGLNTSLDEIYKDAQEWEQADLPPNVNWTRVSVASRQDMNKWINVKNEWLRAAWTPNQSMGERWENEDLMNKLSAEMSALEVLENA